MYLVQLFIIIYFIVSVASNDIYSVKVVTDHHVNVVDSRFLSFTIDPKYLFSSNENYNSKECICMASSLTPAYIRIAGPSTSHITFQNSTISIHDLQLESLEEPEQKTVNDHSNNDLEDISDTGIAVSHRKWSKFVSWAKSTGFDLVFAVNHNERTASGMWDPNTALHILTVAEKADIGDIFWQLGYECQDQSIEEYLNDLETLRVIVETFPQGKAGKWKLVGGDITNCLQEHSKNTFKDFVTKSVDMMDAVLLNGNSSSQELERMSDSDRINLLKFLYDSTTPLWLTEHPQRLGELDRAADWMASLGYSARNGFSVHFRELDEKEMFEPTMSFYMALLFKNLVGERVLDVDIEASQAIMFAHCTSLRHKPVPGAVTLYGANMDNEPAKFSLRLSKKEEGGDIMQFVIGIGRSGNVAVNGRPMYFEGDIKPVVKRVRPFKTLVLNLPANSFGFWVLANTDVEACQIIDEDQRKERIQKTSFTDTSSDISADYEREKRSIDMREFNIADSTPEDSSEVFDEIEIREPLIIENKALKERLDNLNKDLKVAHKFFEKRLKADSERLRRSVIDEENRIERKKSRKQTQKHTTERKKDYDRPKASLIGKLLDLGSRRDNTKHSKHERTKILSRFTRSLVKRNSRVKSTESDIVQEISSRNSRDVEKYNLSGHVSSENDNNGGNNLKLHKFLKSLYKELHDFPVDVKGKSSKDKSDDNEKDLGRITLKTKLIDDGAIIDLVEKSENGLIGSTFEKLLNVMANMNNSLNRFWNAFTLLED